MLMVRYLGLVAIWFTGLSQAGWTFRANSCDSSKQDQIREELNRARDLILATVVSPNSGVYYDTFFDEFTRNSDGWLLQVGGVFARFDNMANEQDDQYTFEITCDNSNPRCQGTDFASMNAQNKVMNFCDRFFATNAGLATYATTLSNCATIDLRAAQRTRAVVIIHELSHTGFAMSPASRTRDFAYGFNGCYLLPLMKFDRNCVPYKDPGTIECPRGDDPTVEGVCPGTYSARNADTWSFIAAGVGFSRYCDRDIPLPPLPPIPNPVRRRELSGGSRILRARQDNQCFEDDSLPFDAPGPDGPDA